MLPSLRSITALGITTVAGGMFFLGAAAPAAAQEELPAAPEGEQQLQELPQESGAEETQETEQGVDPQQAGASEGLLGPVLGQSGLVTVFLGNYQINH